MEQPSTLSLVAKIAWLYHINGYTQQEIADMLSLSRTKVARSLAKAKELGIVQMHINTSFRTCLETEIALRKKLGLQNVLVVPSGRTAKDRAMNISVAGAQYMNSTLNCDDILGMSWGRFLLDMARHLQPVRTVRNKRIEVVQMMGGWTPAHVDPDEIVQGFARGIGAGGVSRLFAPAVVANVETKEWLMQEKSIQDVLAKAKRCTKSALCVGSLEDDANLVMMSALSKEDIAGLRAAGAVGEMLTWHYDIHGQLVNTPLNERVVSVPPETIRRIPVKTLITAGPSKTRPIVGAARGGFINELITDEDTARGVLSLL